MQACTIAMMQIHVTPNKLEENLSRIEKSLTLAKGAQIALFPECCDLGWAGAGGTVNAQPIPGGATVRFLQRLAKEHAIYLVAGITEKEGEQLYNTAVFLSPTGELLGKHRKINLVAGVEDMYRQGDAIRVYDTPMGKIGIDICADNLMPSIMIGESMAKMGAKIILAPSAWAVAPQMLKAPYGEEWRKPFRYLSQNYGLDIVSVSNVGPILDGAWRGWHCIGHSMAVGNRGEKIVELSHGPEAEEVFLYTSSC